MIRDLRMAEQTNLLSPLALLHRCPAAPFSANA
jgi:hypothetical protein